MIADGQRDGRISLDFEPIHVMIAQVDDIARQRGRVAHVRGHVHRTRNHSRHVFVFEM